MRCLPILLLLSAPAFAWQAPIDASKTGTGLVPLSRTGTTRAMSRGRAGGASDDFNRADGTAMGTDWVETAGDMAIISNTGYGGYSSTSAMVHATLSDDYATSTQVIDFLPRVSGPGVVFVAFVCGHASSSSNLFIKVQDNNSDGLYDRVFFYKGYNGGGWGASTYYYDLVVPTVSGRMKLTFENNGDRAVLDVDRDMDGTWDEQCTCDGILAAGLTLGTGFGISSYSQGAFDNWSVNQGSEPGVAYCLGDLGVDAPCPCGNDNDGSVPESGCANGQYTSGAKLTASGKASVSGDTLVLIGTNTEHNQAGLFFQADNDLTPGLVWGDGLRCAGGALKRLGVSLSDATGHSDTSTFTMPISALAGNVVAGGTKYYQLWYGNPLASPCSSQFNTTNGYAITWIP